LPLTYAAPHTTNLLAALRPKRQYRNNNNNNNNNNNKWRGETQTMEYFNGSVWTASGFAGFSVLRIPVLSPLTPKFRTPLVVSAQLLLLFIVDGKDPQGGARGIDLPFHVVGWRQALMCLPIQVTQL
jgi:hypothetical protein